MYKEMSFNGVVELVRSERRYQDEMPEHSEKQDSEWSVGDWLIFMETMLSAAKKCVYHMDTQDALRHVRKLAALAFACMEYNETTARPSHQIVAGSPLGMAAGFDDEYPPHR